MPSQRQSLTMAMATQPTATVTTERGPLMLSQRQSLTMLPMAMATQPTATVTTERGLLMPSQRQSRTMATATQPTAMAITERGLLMPSQRQSRTMATATLLMVTMVMESKVPSADLEPSMTATLKGFPESLYHSISISTKRY